MDILSYIVIALVIAVNLLTLWMTFGMIVNAIFEWRFDYCRRRSSEAMNKGDFDLAGKYNDRMGTAAKRADFVTRLTFFDL